MNPASLEITEQRASEFEIIFTLPLIQGRVLKAKPVFPDTFFINRDPDERAVSGSVVRTWSMTCDPQDLIVCGVPVGRHIQPPESQPEMASDGSVMVVLATDAPLTSRQLHRLCVRAAAGLARTGGTYGHSSGDFVIAFSTAGYVEHEPASLTTVQTRLADEKTVMAGLFPAVAESVEEAVLNSLFRAETVTGRDGNTRYALPVEDVAANVESMNWRSYRSR